MLGWVFDLLRLLSLLPRDPATAKRMDQTSSKVGDWLQPWIYGLIALVVAHLMGVLVLLVIIG
jgi:hypothetical protein